MLGQSLVKSCFFQVCYLRLDQDFRGVAGQLPDMFATFDRLERLAGRGPVDHRHPLLPDGGARLRRLLLHGLLLHPARRHHLCLHQDLPQHPPETPKTRQGFQLERALPGDSRGRRPWGRPRRQRGGRRQRDDRQVGHVEGHGRGAGGDGEREAGSHGGGRVRHFDVRGRGGGNEGQREHEKAHLGKG